MLDSGRDPEDNLSGLSTHLSDLVTLSTTVSSADTRPFICRAFRLSGSGRDAGKTAGACALHGLMRGTCRQAVDLCTSYAKREPRLLFSTPLFAFFAKTHNLRQDIGFLHPTR